MTKKAYPAATDPAAVWWHTVEQDPGMLRVSRAALGEFFYVILHYNVKIGEVWPFSPVRGALVLVSVKMTKEVKDEIEAETKFRFRFRFREPPTIVLNSEIVDV